MTGALKIIARDAEDLTVVSACLQDALIPLNEMRYLPQERRFILVANRFRWERAAKGNTAPDALADATFEADEDFGDLQRINSGICIDRVLAVRSRGVDQGQPDAFLSLLSLHLDGDKLSLLFAGGGVIQLDIEALALYLHDLGTAWPTQWRPDHAIAGAGETAAR
jgi:hypothetical protein